MRIALIIERIDARRGGAETSTSQYIRSLVDRGCEVHVVTSGVAELPDGVHVHRLDCSWPLRSQRTLAFIRRADALVRQERFDLVHAVTPCTSADIYQPRGGTAIEAGRRSVASRRSFAARQAKALALRLNPRHRLMRRMERQLLASPTGPTVAAVSGYVARQLLEHYGLGEPRVRVVFNGVDLRPFDGQDSQAQRAQTRGRFGLDGPTVVALSVAHNFKLKGLHSAIAALARLAGRTNRPIKLLVVGRGNARPFRRQARRMGVGEQVIFVGPTPRIAPFFYAADLLVHPTFYDPCSRVVLEALACGLPVITTRHNGAAELIVDGQQGYIIESGHDVEALADRMGRLLDDEHRRRCSQAARELRPQVAMQRHVEQMLALYGEVMAAKGRR